MGEVGIMEEVYQASYKWNFSVENGRTLMISWRFQTWGSGRMMLLQAEKESSSHHLLRCIVQADYMRIQPLTIFFFQQENIIKCLAIRSSEVDSTYNKKKKNREEKISVEVLSKIEYTYLIFYFKPFDNVFEEMEWKDRMWDQSEII